MDRIQDPTATADKKFQEASGATPATHLRALWLNGMQEECCSFIEGEDLTLDAQDTTQLRQALDRRFPITRDDISDVTAMTGVRNGQGFTVTSGAATGQWRATTGNIKSLCDADVNGGIYRPFDGDDGTNGGVVRAIGVSAQVAPKLDVRWFGVTFDDATDDSQAWQAAIDFASYLTWGGVLSCPSGVSYAKGLILKTRVVIEGSFIERTVLKLPAGTVGNIIDSYEFDAFLASGEADVQDGVPTNFGLINLTLDGNRENVTGTPTATLGWGARLYGKRLVLDNVRINGVKGSGLYTALGSNSSPPFDYRTESKPGYIKGLRIYGCEYDGWIYQGPTDIPIGDVFIGWPGNSLVDTAYDSSKRSLVFPSERPTNMVIHGSAELTGFIHVFGNKHGWGYRIGDGTTVTRVKATYLMAETTFGGVQINDNVRLQCALLDVHDNDGGDGSNPFLQNNSTEPVTISNVEMRRGGDDNGSTFIESNGNRLRITDGNLMGQGNPGHGVVDSGANNSIKCEANSCVGTAYDATDSVGHWVKAAASRHTADVFTVGCTIGQKYGTGAGIAHYQGTDRGSATPFDNFNAAGTALRNAIDLFDSSNNLRNHTKVSIQDIDASVTGFQTFSVNHNLLWQPTRYEVQATLVYESGTSPGIARAMVTNVSATQITFGVECTGGAAGEIGVNLTV